MIDTDELRKPGELLELYISCARRNGQAAYEIDRLRAEVECLREK